MNIQDLTSIYESCREFYPEISDEKADYQKVAGLRDVILKFDLILLDAYGVLTNGGKAIPQALETLKLIRELGKDIHVISNDTMHTGEQAVEKYNSLGFSFKKGEITTSLDVVNTFVKELSGISGLVMVAHEGAKLKGFKNLYDTQGVIPKHTQAILFLTGAGWNEEFQENLVKSAKGQQFSLALGNPDVGAPKPDGSFVKTPGYYMADFIERAKQEDFPVLLGKPDGVIFDTVLSDAVADAENVLMVGDTLHTDILGGQAAGVKTMLVESGIYGKSAENMIEQTGIVPDYLAPSL